MRTANFHLLLTHNRACPEGLLLGQLKPEHATLVAAYWYPNAKDQPNTQRYFESMIRNYHSVAAYQADDPTKPVGWAMQYPNGHFAHGYVLEEFRRRRLIELFAQEIFQKSIGDGVLPETTISLDNPIRKVAVRLGMIELCRVKTLKLACVNSVH